MENLLYTEINIVGAALLLLLLHNMNKSGFKAISVDQRLFNGIMLLNLLIFLFDTGMWLADGNPLPVLRVVNYFVTTLYYIFNPLICFHWLLYTDFKIYESKSGLVKRIRFYAIPAIVSAIMSLASVLTEWLFVIDEGNNYSRGPLFLVMAFSAFFYLALACAISLNDVRKNGWEENKSVNLYLVIFPVVLIVAATIQILFFGVSIIWICCMLACVSIYINIQNGQISTDHLTGLYNRRRLDQYLQRRTKVRRVGEILFAIMLDLDEFKSINDNYGHIEGDKALIRIAELLRQVCKGSDDFIARMGGDEFVVVGERAELGELEQLMNEMHARVFEYNQNRRSNYALSFSMGYSVFRQGDTVDSFLASADKAMYRSKHERKMARGERQSPLLCCK